MGVAIFLSHICGEQNKNLPLLVAVRYGKRGMISVGKEITLATAGETFPECVIMGNVDPVVVQEGIAARGPGSLQGVHRGRHGLIPAVMPS